MSDPVLKEAAPLQKSARIQVNPPVFYISAGLILLFAVFGAVFAEPAAVLFTRLQATIVSDFGWFYVAAVAGFLIFVIYLMFSRHGDVKLGPDESEPDYSYLSWFAMLFSAGMGIGLVFFGVAEPIQHYASPPVGVGGPADAARREGARTQPAPPSAVDRVPHSVRAMVPPSVRRGLRKAAGRERG